MNIKIRNYQEILKFQEGGPMEAPVEEGVPAPELAPQGGEDSTQQILMAAQLALQSQDCQLAMQVCQVLMLMAGGGTEAAPQAPENQEPVYRRGGSLKYWRNK